MTALAGSSGNLQTPASECNKLHDGRQREGIRLASIDYATYQVARGGSPFQS
jgi:hypothetical protein